MFGRTFLPLYLSFSPSLLLSFSPFLLLSFAFYLPSDYYIDIQWRLYILCFGGYLFSHFNRKR